MLIKVSQHCVQKQVKPCNNVMTLQADIQVPQQAQQALNSTGSMFGMVWVTYSLLGCDDVQSGLAMQMEVIPSPQTSVPVKLHTVTSQTQDCNILGQQESLIEYIPVYRILMLCCWASSSQHFEGLQCLCLQGQAGQEQQLLFTITTFLQGRVILF